MKGERREEPLCIRADLRLNYLIHFNAEGRLHAVEDKQRTNEVKMK